MPRAAFILAGALCLAALWLDGRRVDRNRDALRLRRRMRTAVAVQLAGELR